MNTDRNKSHALRHTDTYIDKLRATHTNRHDYAGRKRTERQKDVQENPESQ